MKSIIKYEKSNNGIELQYFPTSFNIFYKTVAVGEMLPINLSVGKDLQLFFLCYQPIVLFTVTIFFVVVTIKIMERLVVLLTDLI